MPWIDTSLCTGCGMCERICPSGAISMNDNKTAVIEMSLCLRCGRCHDSCPSEAVRHDSELVPLQVEKNLKDARTLVEKSISLLGDEEEGKGTLSRLLKHYRKEKTVLEKTIMELERLETSLFEKNAM